MNNLTIVCVVLTACACGFFLIEVLKSTYIELYVWKKQKLEIDRLNIENKRLKVRLRTLMPCGYCKHSEKEPVEICTPCLCGECDNWEF